MRELIADMARWRSAGRRVAVARVVDVEGSGPRAAGAAMAVSDDGEVAGSVSGGCVEGAVVAHALALLGGEEEARMVTFGYGDDEAFAVGLTCGGTIHLFVEELEATPVLEALAVAVSSGRPVALATVVERLDGLPGVGDKLLVTADGARLGGLGDADLDRVVARDALGELAAGGSGVRRYGAHGEARADEVRAFVESFAPPPEMVVFGAVDFTSALVRLAKVLGYRVVVCDARAVFATRARFPAADEVVVDWPDRWLRAHGRSLGPRDAVCILTHDHKFDIPAIEGALATAAGYVGAMGSRRTHAERMERLRAAGVREESLARLHAPIGLDLGARTPEETAVAICAEIIAARTGRPVPSLRDAVGPIHG